MGDNERGFPATAHVLANSGALTPVVGNDCLLATISTESLHRAVSEREGEGKRGGRETEGEGGEGREREEKKGGRRERKRGGMRAIGPESYSVATKSSVKRMRCEGGEEGRMVKRRHTIYSSRSHEDVSHSTTIRTSKSATALSLNSDPRPGFTFARPTPHTERTPVSVPMATDTGIRETGAPSNTPFKFSAPRKYPARQAVTRGNSEDGTKCALFGDDFSVGGSVCGASPIPRLPELTRHNSQVGSGQGAVFSGPLSPPRGAPHSQLNLITPLPTHSPNLLDKITSELVDRYPMTTPLATPTDKEVWLMMNDSYHQAVYVRGSNREPHLPLAKPGALEFNASFSHDNAEGSKVMQEVSFSFKLNSGSSCHGNVTRPPSRQSRVPLSPVNHTLTPHTPVSAPLQLRPPKLPSQKRFPVAPFLSHSQQFTDISTSLSVAGSHGNQHRATGVKAPKMKK